MKKYLHFFFLFIALAFSSAQSNQGSLRVNAYVNPFLSISMDSSKEFVVVDSRGDLIPTKEIGSILISSNYNAWRLMVNSSNEISLNTGGLRLEGEELYIPYNFAVKDGDTTIIDQFSTKSSPQSITPVAGKDYILHLFFTDDDTIWQQGTYSDTLVFTVTTD